MAKSTGKTKKDSSTNQKIVDLSDRYINRELSWLEFNARVLEEADDSTNPLLERIKFIKIFTTNLEEFFMVRVAGLFKMEKSGISTSQSPDRMNTTHALERIKDRTEALLRKQHEIYRSRILPGMAEYGIDILEMKDLSQHQIKELEQFFYDNVEPVLTPLAFDAAHPFPFLSNQSTYLVVVPEFDQETRSRQVLGFVEIPSILPRLIEVKTKTKHKKAFVWLDDLVAANLDKIFYGVRIESSHPIRVNRNLDYNLLENEVSDLLKTIQREMIEREHQEVIRFDVDESLPQDILDLLKERLGISDREIYRLPRPLYLAGLDRLYELNRPQLKDEPFNPRLHHMLDSEQDIFSLISEHELMVHHPYDSFYAVVEFLMSAAHDPQVFAIKQTLYRTAGDSPIIDALIQAAENGKQVTALVELKARFDEKNNILWARRMERAGINVIFGFVGLKTHAKFTLVVRKEQSKLVRYSHISTGNYNSTTARQYCDIGYFTANEEIGRDIASIFNLISGFNILTGEHTTVNSLPRMSKIAMGPVNLRDTILASIRNEIENKKKHGVGEIQGIMNALVDRDIIEALYDASQKGVTINLIVRGICCLKPQVPGLSDNIRIFSLLDRFLEHGRIYYFKDAGQDRIYISSADWMPRNMDRRIEILCPVESPKLKDRLINEILKTLFADNVKLRELNPDGSYQKVRSGEPVIRAQEEFIRAAREGGIKSIPYDRAIRHSPSQNKGSRPVAKKK